MTSIINRLDGLAGIEGTGRAAKLLERGAFLFLLLMTVSAPHSIAASQTAWLAGTLLVLIRFAIRLRPRLWLSPEHYALLAFFAWSAISAVASFEPAVSIDKLRNVALFMVFFFAAAVIRNLRTVYLVAFALIVSSMVNVIWTPVERILGRGVEVHGISPESPLAKALIYDGDTLLKANGKKITDPGDLVRELEQNETVKLIAYRPDYPVIVDVFRSDLLAGETADERLGIGSWSKSHNWRSQGFFGHFVTYAEVLQLIASLTLGLFIAGLVRFSGIATRSRVPMVLLAIALAGMCLALFLTVTRASQLAFLISAFLILILGSSRKVLLLGAVIVLPLIVGGLIFLQQSRHTGFFDPTDESTLYRLTMWRDGARLVTDSPRNLVFGIGMDSIKDHWREWGLFDGGRMPMGHFHSTPVQILVERGVPALLLWLIVLAIYARTLWRGLRRSRNSDWRMRGVLLGCAGAAVGFVASGMVHYNLGDGEVAMVFYLLMALGVMTVNLSPEIDGAEASTPITPDAASS